MRVAAACAVFLFGSSLPNLGGPFLFSLGTLMLGYGIVLVGLWRRAIRQRRQRSVAQIALAADVTLAAFALLVFAPDPAWTIMPAGLLVVVSGGFRLPSGGLLAAASLSLSYLVVSLFREAVFDLVLQPPQVAIQIVTFVLTGGLVTAVLAEAHRLRQREEDLYEPVLRTQNDAGEAVLMVKDGRLLYWNEALRRMTGLREDELGAISSIHEIIAPNDPMGLRRCFFDLRLGECATFEGRVLGKGGRRTDVEISVEFVSSEHGSYHVAIARDITAQRVTERGLQHQALHDPLTGLANRGLLVDRLQQALLAARRPGGATGILLLDLDGFKQVNDTLGHEAGDSVLRDVAARLRAKVRESDTVARVGGDEFVVVLVNTAASGAKTAAREIVHLLQIPFPYEGRNVQVGASIGIAVAPEHGEDTDTLLRHADSAMYEAKRAGGGYAVYEERAP